VAHPTMTAWICFGATRSSEIWGKEAVGRRRRKHVGIASERGIVRRHVDVTLLVRIEGTGGLSSPSEIVGVHGRTVMGLEHLALPKRRLQRVVRVSTGTLRHERMVGGLIGGIISCS
jgi:hypothetical protein